jgi:hypothetical protein
MQGKARRGQVQAQEQTPAGLFDKPVSLRKLLPGFSKTAVWPSRTNIRNAEGTLPPTRRDTCAGMQNDYPRRITGLSSPLFCLLIFVLSMAPQTARAQATPDKAIEKPQRATADSLAKTLADLPPAVLPAISSTLGRYDARYGIEETADGYSAQNDANHLAAHYAAKGVEIRSQNANLGFEFQDWGYGEHPANKSKATVSPNLTANRVEYRRGALTEWYVNGPLGLEQGFTISQPPGSLPDSNHEALDIALRLRGNLSASVEPGRHALTLRDQTGVETLRYGPLLAYDASGRELESWMEVQDGSLRLRVNTTGARYPITVDPWVQAAELTVSSALSGAIGRSVAVGGNTIVVGAPGTTVGTVAQGAVFVFVEPATGGWAAASTYELTASNGAAGDDFGLSVGIDAGGDTIVVGAPQTNTSAGAGVAYVFVEPTPGGWTTTSTYNAELVADDVSPFAEFGWSVGIDASGDTVVVGAFANPFGFNNPKNEKGEAYVFVEPTVGGARTWTPGPEPETAKLIASDGVAGDSLGISVGINESGDTVVAGAVDATVTAQYQGAAYVFVEPTVGGVPTWVTPTTTPTFNAKLTASDATSDSHLGWSVAISGNTILAGAYQANIGSNTAQGAAYVFVNPGPTPGDWATPTTPPTFNAKLTASDGAADDEFGTAVGISGSTVVVSAASTAGAMGAAASAAYVFVEPGGGWVPTPPPTSTQELTSGTAGNLFGYSVGISGNTIVVATPDATNASKAQGVAYVFTQAEPYAQYSPPQVSFGNVNLNAPATQTVNVMNTGGAPLIILTAIPSADVTIFTVPQYTCNGIVSSPPAYPLTISPGGSCTFTVQFNPTAQGAVNLTFGFEDNAGVGQSNVTSTVSGLNFLQSLPLTGTGVTGGTSIAIFSTGNVGFPSSLVGSTVTATPFTLTNAGSAAMNVSLVTVTTNGVYPNQFIISNASCGNGTVLQTPAYGFSSFSIVAGDICTFTLGFTPEVAGSVTGQIAFVETAASSNICGGASLATCMTGSNGSLEESIPFSTAIGTGTPGIAVGAQNESFPNQTLGVKATAPIINVSNTGNVPLYFAAVGIEGPNQADFGETTTCSTSSPLPPAGINVCMITVTFTPSTTAPESATLFITNSAQNTNIPLMGNGVVPTASATASTLSFGLQLDTQAVVGVAGTPITVTLKNTGTAGVLTGITSTITPGANTNAGDFSLNPAGTCGVTLNPGLTCTINVTFAPTSAIPSSSTSGVSESATLSIADNASQTPQTLSFSGTGVPFTFVGTPPSPATILDGQPDMFAINVTVGPGSGTLTFSCSGLTVSAVVVAGATCTFIPNSIMQTGATQTVPVMVTITTTARALPEKRPGLPLDGMRMWVLLSLLAMILLFALWTSQAAAPRYRAKIAWVFLALIVLCGGWMAACGSASSGGSSTPETQKGQDTFTITGKLGNVTESINAVLNVM